MKHQFLYTLALSAFVNCENSTSEMQIPDHCTNKKLNAINIINDFDKLHTLVIMFLNIPSDFPQELLYAEYRPCKIVEKKETESGDYGNTLS